MEYIVIGLISFGLGFVAGAAYAYVFGETSAETHPEEKDADQTSADCNDSKKGL